MIHAYAAHQPGANLQPFTYAPEALAADEVDITVDYCGICHSDISMIDNSWGFSAYPMVAGHEILGRINAVGSAVEHLSVGDSVGVGWHAGYCDTCSCCMAGDHNLCADAVATVNVHRGGFADRVRAKKTAVIKIDATMLNANIAPLLCGGITVYNPLEQYNIRPGDRVAVIGIGGLGHMALAFLKAWGCHVSAFSSNPNKREALLAQGVHAVYDSTDAASYAALTNSFDFILSTTNHSMDWNAIISTLKPKGRLHLVGAVLKPLEISLFGLLTGQRQLSASPVGSPASIQRMLAFANRHAIHAQVEVFPMSDINTALDRVRSGQAQYRVVLSNR